MGMTEAILLTIITAATPLLIAALGELVVERSGVLNLGVEGMMLIGAVVAFQTGTKTGNLWVALLVGSLAGAALSAVHAVLTMGDLYPVGAAPHREPTRVELDVDDYDVAEFCLAGSPPPERCAPR